MNGKAIRVPMALLALLLGACGAPEFGAGTAKEAIEKKPLALNGEQLILTGDQVTCGDREELWHLTQLGPGHTIGRLTPAGRALNFSDDVRVALPGQGDSSVQVSGTFPLRVLTVSSIEDHGANAKRVEARTAVVIEHECFKRPLPVLMGIRKGEFSASTAPMFQMKMREFTWAVEELVHP